jgi:hypothetical protein
MKTLYVIGNGFDIFHELKTKYSDFNQFVNDNNSDLAMLLEKHFTFQVDSDYLWKDFENDLSTFDHVSFFASCNNIDIASDNFKASEVYGLEDAIAAKGEELIQKIRDEFTNWIESIEYPEKESIHKKMLSFAPNCKFINFNYTDTLEILYNIPNSDILYLHNNANEMHGILVLGHAQEIGSNTDFEELDENGDSNRTMFTDSQNLARAPFYALRKDTAQVLNEHRAFFEMLNNVEQVIVLGHSLGSVDWPYFREIRAQTPNSLWKISYRCENEKLTKEKLAREMLGDATIDMIRIEELMKVTRQTELECGECK